MNEEQFLRKLAGYGFAVMLLILCLSVAVRYKEEYNIINQERDATQQEELLYAQASPTMIPEITVYPAEDVVWNRRGTDGEVWEVLQIISQESMAALMEKTSDRCVLIRKPAGSAGEWEISENLCYYQITFTLRGTRESLQASSVLRMWGNVLYYGQTEQNEILKDFTVLSYEDEGTVISEVVMTFDKCYMPEVDEQEEYYIIRLKKYSEVYDKIVVLDAGHGGKDTGAEADKGRVEESAITLKLLLYLKELLETNTDITVFCTRTEDVYPTLQERADLALGMEADLFISWHCNSSESTKRNGTEMLYNAQQGAGELFNSRAFAEICQEKLVKALGTKNGGLIDRQDLHIVRRATMPVVLLEVAYLSNDKNLEMILETENQQKAARAIFDSIMEAYEEMGQ